MDPWLTGHVDGREPAGFRPPGQQVRASQPGGAGGARHDGGVQLPVMPPVAPMLAKAVQTAPTGAYLYEPKWDGFWFFCT